jgi:hypothetical protein
MNPERSLLIILLCLSPVAFAEERFGFQGIADSTFTNHNLSWPSSSYSYGGSDSQTLWNGGLTLLASFRLRENLVAFYEGRFNHSEGLSGTEPRLQLTRTDPVVQGYLRYSPHLAWDLNIQLGKFGSPFGEFLTRNYSNENPLIGFPLIYTHRTPVNADYLPSDPDELLSYRGRGQSAGFYAFDNRGAWLPLVNFAYPTGVMAFGNPGRLDYRFALVNSSLSNPLNLGTPGQRLQWIGGGGISCFPGLHLGASYAEGPYLNASVNHSIGSGQSINDFDQKTLGFDLQYTLHHLEIYAELVFNRFSIPNIHEPFGATGYYLEVKRTWTPRIFTAVRWNQIYFDRFRDGFAPGQGPRVDYNVESLELGFGYRFTESLLAKFAYQYNRTLSDQVPRDHVFAAQLVYTFDLRNLLRIR